MKLDKAVKINELTTALEYADKTNMDLRAENERLRVEIGEVKLVIETQDNQIEHLRAENEFHANKAKALLLCIEAALAIAKRTSLQTTSASVIGEIIAALEGEA